MLVTLIIILLLIGVAVVGAIYSNFLVIYSNFFESENYHKAYYASISALERGELVTKQRAPGYVGSGGFILGTGQGGKPDINDGGSDKSLSGFSYFENNANASTVFRTVDSRATRIPTEGGGDVEWMLSADDSPNYNTMGFENSEVFLLYYDKSEGNPYKSSDIEIIQSHPKSISGEIRLPMLLHLSGGYGYLDTSSALIGKKGDLPEDDAIVDRQIRGNYEGDSFNIYSTQSTSRNSVTYSHDSIFRESDINAPLQFNFSKKGSPITNSLQEMHKNNNDVLRTIISQKEDDIKELSFENIFKNGEDITLRLSLLNLLKTVNSGQYYPFLEYYAAFYDDNGNPVDIADKYYTIDGEGNFKDYQVNTIIHKPTSKESVLGNFTSIF